MKATTAKQVLVATKWLLTKFDWCQKAWYKDTDNNSMVMPDRFVEGSKQLKCCCLDGALELVQCDDQARMDAQDILEQVIGRDDIITWNDEKKRTKKQVLSALNRAIKKA